MTIDYIFTKRLSFVKYFHNLALTQANQPSPQNSISVLMFHDCIELFLILAAEKVEANVSDRMFILDYVNVINQKLVEEKLSQKASIKRLNDARKAFKHKGILLEESEIESLKITSRLFLDENSPLIFDINFEDISMIDLVENQNVKQILKNSQDFLNDDNLKKSLEHIAIAYLVLIKEYEISKEISGFSVFNVLGWEFRFQSRFNLSEGMRKIVDAFENVNKALKPLFLGIDYRKYVRFISLTPDVLEHRGAYPENGIDLTEDYYEKFTIVWFRDRSEQDFKKVDVQYCFDFIINASLKLQEFDFSLNT